MKKILVAAAGLLLCSTATLAQGKNEKSESTNISAFSSTTTYNYLNRHPRPKTLLSDDIYSSGYGTVVTQYSRFNKQDAMFLGAYGGWMINHKFMIGLGGYGLVTRHRGFGVNPETNKQNLLRMGYGGLVLEYTFAGNQVIHLTVNTLIGAGGITNGYATKTRGNEDWHSLSSSAFFVAQPGVNIEANITKWFRLGAGGSYRLIAANRLDGISNSDMSSPAVNLSFKFGEF